MPTVMKVNYGNFETKATEIDSKNDTLKKKLEEIKDAIQSVQGEQWESDSAVNIRKKIGEKEEIFEQYYKVVKQYTDLMRRTASTLKKTEQTIQDNANAFK